MDLILRDNGLLQNISGIPEIIMEVDLGKGIYATPGPPSFLYSAADLNLPIAATTFDTLGTLFSPSGNLAEVGYFPEPGRAISPLYDDLSNLGEIWSRYRSWEGAVALETLVYYLTGYQADVVDGWLALAPRLLHDAGFVEASRIPFGDLHLSMRWAREDDDSFLMTLTPDSDPATAGLNEYRLRLTVPLSEITSVELDGTSLSADKYQILAPWEEATEVRITVISTKGPQSVRIR